MASPDRIMGCLQDATKLPPGDQLELICSYFLPLAGPQRGNNLGVLHGLFNAARTLLKIHLKRIGVFKSGTEPETKVTWDNANSYEQWMLCELKKALAEFTGDSVTCPSRWTDGWDEYMDNFNFIKGALIERLRGAGGGTVPKRVAPTGPLTLSPPPGGAGSPFQPGLSLDQKLAALKGPSAPPPGAADLQARLDKLRGPSDLQARLNALKKGGTRNKRTRQSRRKYTSKVRYGRVGTTNYGQERY